ncbi:MAG: OadG family protein [Candidatus Wallbacteria bacterium]|nr:OadG family protein [Candidatus Wallbacteria bacterium]
MMTNLLFGLELTLLGMGVVFVALCLLAFVIHLFSYLQKPGQLFPGSGPSTEEERRLIAVIAAAATAVLDESFELKKIVLVKERRQFNTLWSFEGKVELMNQNISKGRDK